MRNVGKFTLLALLVLTITSCGREKLTPVYEPVTVNQLRNDKPVNFSYQIPDTQIDEYAKNAGKFPLLGKLFQAIAVVLANTTISSEGGHELDLPSVDVDFSFLSSVDFELIQHIDVDSLMILVRNPTDRDSLNFINKLEIYGKFDTPVKGLPVNNEGYSRLVYFNSAETPLGCEGKCIKLTIADVDWKKLLAANKAVHLQPRLVINSVPLSTMKLAGAIDFSVKFKLGF